MTLAPFELDTSLSPPRREAAGLTAEKRRLENGCRWAQQNAEKLPHPTHRHPILQKEIERNDCLRLKNKRLGSVWTLVNNLDNIKIPEEK